MVFSVLDFPGRFKCTGTWTPGKGAFVSDPGAEFSGGWPQRNSVFDNHQNEAPSQRQGLKSVLSPKKAELSCSAAKCCCQARRLNNNHNNSGKEREPVVLVWSALSERLQSCCSSCTDVNETVVPTRCDARQMLCGDCWNSRNHHLQKVKRFHSQAAFRRSKPCV